MPRWIKGFITIGLLALLLNAVEWGEIPGHLSRLRWPYAAAALLLMVLQFPLSSWKWSWSLRLHALDYRQGFLLRVLCIGFFFNNFLPSAVGGDAYRVFRTRPSSGEVTSALSAVLVERLVGLAALVMVGAAGAMALIDETPIAFWYLGLAAAGGIAAFGLLLVLWRGWLKPVTGILRRFAWFAAAQKGFSHVLRPHREWVPLLFLSLVFQLTSPLILYLLFSGVGAPISPAACALVSAAAGLASIVPLSINGIGIVEGSIAGVAVALGVPYEAALLVALLNRLLVLPLSAACGLIYLAESRQAAAGAAPTVHSPH